MPLTQTFRSVELPATVRPVDVEDEFKRYGPILLRYCQKLTGSKWDAEDLAQDTLLRALPHFTHSHENPQAFLFRIAKNAWIDKCRKQKVPNECSFEPELLEARVEVDTMAVAEALAKLIRHLSPMQRVVFLLRDVFAFTALEVADMIGTTEGAVKSSLHRARKTIEVVREKESQEQIAVTEDVTIQKGMLNAYLEAFWKSDAEALVVLAQNDVIHPVHALNTLWISAEKQSARQARMRLSSADRFNFLFVA